MAEYKDFVTTTGYKQAGGLCGFNCRHSFHPFDPRYDKPLYTSKQLETINDETVQLPNGKAVKTYQATQMQRAMERQVRKLKQGLEMAKAADDPQLQVQYQKLATAENRRLKSFCESTGLPRQRFRERVTG